MSVPIYGATRDGILAHLAQWGAQGSVLPGYESIDTAGSIMLQAGADVAVALQRAGHGASPSLTAGTVEYVYVTGLINARAALMFARANGLPQGAGDSDEWRRHEAAMADLRAGGIIGSMSATGNQKNAVHYHGDDDRSTVNLRRFKATDYL